MIKVSLIFPMYNVEKYVENSLKSILNQTYNNYEIIAINDGSTDETVKVFNEVLKKENSTIKTTLINKENGGLSDARNAGLNVAQGEWVVFIDSDDVLNPKYIEVLLGDAEKFNSDLSIASYKKVNSDTLFEFDDVVDGHIVPKKELMKMMLSRKKFDAYCGCFLVKRKMIFDNNIMFNKDVKFSVDQAFMWNIVDESQLITINNSKIYNYFLRNGSIMTSSKIEQICSGIEHYTKTIKKLNNLPYDAEIVIDRWKLGILHSAAKLSTFENFMVVKKRLDINFIQCFKIPLFKCKMFSLIGLFSSKILYVIFSKH